MVFQLQDEAMCTPLYTGPTGVYHNIEYASSEWKKALMVVNISN